jgi:hypothetical protein
LQQAKILYFNFVFQYCISRALHAKLCGMITVVAIIRQARHSKRGLQKSVASISLRQARPFIFVLVCAHKKTSRKGSAGLMNAVSRGYFRLI